MARHSPKFIALNRLIFLPCIKGLVQLCKRYRMQEIISVESEVLNKVMLYIYIYPNVFLII